MRRGYHADSGSGQRVVSCGAALLFLLFFVVPFETVLQAKPSQKVEAPAFEGTILGMEVKAGSLALVLDVSSSMRPFLHTIRMELREKTPRNPTLHVAGCGVERPGPRPRVVNGVAPETITAIRVLTNHSTAKTILWITDMADPPNVDGIASLEALLRERRLQLHLITVGKGPPPSIQKVLESREGSWKVVDPKELR